MVTVVERVEVLLFEVRVVVIINVLSVLMLGFSVDVLVGGVVVSALMPL